MAPKRLVLLCFLLAALVLISSHAATPAEGQLAGKKAEEQRKRDPIEESKACPYGCQLFWKGRCWVCKPKPRPPAGDPAHAHAAAAGGTVSDSEEARAKADPQN